MDNQKNFQYQLINLPALIYTVHTVCACADIHTMCLSKHLLIHEYYILYYYITCIHVLEI